MFRRSDSAFGAPIDDTVLLLNAEAGQYHALNPVAARIWQMLAEPVSEEGLVDRLQTEFDVTPEQCRREVQEFLAQLHARGLLQTE
ncbi:MULTISPECIES: HPr-rel-A system PqqD family peptide chaperone [unclassified Sphingomonas]|uniref:HPr-rel-A system PqqD family peptide chaperone n=1 Tax=unclassified Sphingomonas TaxID=196159 RepID=UPI000B054E50|nr:MULTISPECIES: HPr-rel-A system PqqD family peptide chaperone [unclassified Sphingomonas]